jgi:hypothetical protein
MNIRTVNPLYIVYHRKFIRQSYSFEASVSYEFVVIFLFTICLHKNFYQKAY